MNYRMVLVDEIHTRGVTIGTIGQETVIGVVELPLEGIHLQIQCGSLVDIARLVDIDRAHRVNLVVRQGVIELVSTDHGIATAQFRLAMHRSVDIRLTGQTVALDIDGLLIAYFLRVGLLQQRAGLELERGQPIGHQRRLLPGSCLGNSRLLRLDMQTCAGPGQSHRPGQRANRRTHAHCPRSG